MLNRKPQIGILGCGWLGKATAAVLIQKGYPVKGSTTSAESLGALKDLGIEPYVIELTPNSPIDNLKAFLADLKVLIIAVPPKLSQGEPQLLESLEMIFKTYNFSTVEQLIYVSSTGVFIDQKKAVYDEDSRPNNNSQRGEYLIALENLILNQNQVQNCKVIRYGGLIKHGGRHPVHYLSGKKDIPNPSGPVNLIEQADAVNLICKIIECPTPLKIYHGVYPFHPERKEYYLNKAKALHLAPPEFMEDNVSLGKTILSEKTQAELNFRFNSEI